MDKILHLLAVFVAALSPAHARPVETMQYDAGLATYGGVTAWWGSTGDPKVAHLIVRTPKGTVKALPPTLSTFAPTVDVGRGPDGRPLVTYAQCGRTMASCRAYSYNLWTNAQVPLDLGQAVAVAVDGSEVAWFRQAREDGPSQLLVGSLTAPGGVAARVRLPRIGGEAAGGPLALDLRYGHVAYAANAGGDDIRGEGLFAGTPRHVARVDDSGGYGEECTRVLVAPTITATSLTWLRSTSGTSSCGRRRGTLTRSRWADGALAHAEIPLPIPKEAVVTGGHVLALAPSKVDHDQGDRSACGPYNLREEPGHVAGCVMHRLPAPRWLPGRDG